MKIFHRYTLFIRFSKAVNSTELQKKKVFLRISCKKGTIIEHPPKTGGFPLSL